MSDALTLYSFRRCPFAIRARMTLHEKNLKFTTVEEKLKDFSDDLKRLHPEARVPLLVHGDLIIYESAIITEYLDDRFPQPALMPHLAMEKMQVRQWTYWCNYILKPEIDRYKYGPVRLTEDEVRDAEEKLSEYLEKMEQQISSAGWLVGNRFTLADIHVFPFYRQLSKMDPTHPRLSECLATNEWLKKLQKGHPLNKRWRSKEDCV